MKLKLTLVVAMAVACASIQLTAMPTEEETRKAEPVVKKLLAQERAALESGKKTRSEVAAAAMGLAEKTDSEAEKLLLMKGACDFYVHAGEFDKAIETLQAMMMKIPDIPYAAIVSILEYSLRGVSRNSAKDLWAFLDETKSRLRNTDTTHGKKVQSETNIQKFSRLFPGWEVCKGAQGRLGFELAYRGQFNVAVLHPVSQDIPAVVSRTLKLSRKNPCLFLKVSSCDYDGECDWVLSVRVNGKEVLPKHLINKTPNSEPWEDITVPLFAWRGQEVKVEVVVAANGWWNEFASFKRLEIAEGSGRENLIPEAKETVDGYTWSYRVQNGEATIMFEKDGKTSCAVSPNPVGSIVIPAALGGAKVTSIGRDALAGCQELESVTIPQGVKRIGRGAFFECKKLKSVEIPSSVTGIDWCAFYRCNALASVSIPSDSDLKSLENGAFAECFSLKSIAIPNGVTRIARHAFLGCFNLESLTIPATASSIGGEAFRYCINLSSVTMLGEKPDTSVPPGDRPHTSDNIFLDCRKLKEIHVPANAKSWVGMEDWHGVPLVLGREEIVEGKKTYGGYTWSYRVKNGAATLVAEKDGEYSCAVSPTPTGNVSIPPTLNYIKVTSIGRDAFMNCTELTSVTIPEGVTSIERDAFYHCNGLKTVKIPTSMKQIEWGAFNGCSLTSVTIPDGVTHIGVLAFTSCRSLTTVVIPSSVRRIGPGAFLGCGELTSFTMRGERPDAPSDIFKYCGKLKEIHVPANAKSWEGMKEWQGIPLVFDAEAAESRREQSRYMIVDLDKSGKDAVSYLDDVPNGGWGDEYRTKKMVLRKIAPGSFEYMPGKTFKITKPFYIGVFEVTQKQYEMVMKGNPSEFKGDMRPVERVSYADIRGSNKGLGWPKDNLVDDDSYLGKLRERIGLEFDLPTEVQWEYACRAGTTGDFNVDGVEMVKLGKCIDNGGLNDHHVNVGGFIPNAWGLYDMHGNVWEWCLDRGKDGYVAGGNLDWNAELKETDTDPKGLAEGASRFHRGGSWLHGASGCRSSRRLHCPADSRQYHDLGFRLACPAGANDSKGPVPNVEYKFSYKLENGKVIITGIDPKPVGTVVIPDKIDGHLVTRIEGYNDRSPFWGCDQLTKVVLPAGLELGSFDSGVFISCKSLSSIEVSESNKELASLDGVLYSKDFSTLCVYPKTRESIKLSPKTKKVKACAFRGCALKTAKIPEGVEVIDHWNFAECPNLVSVEFPESVTELGCSSFGVSDNMKKIVFNGDAPRTRSAWGQTLFSFAPSNLVVEVRKGTKGWKSPNSTELPERWPTNQSESRPIYYIGEAKVCVKCDASPSMAGKGTKDLYMIVDLTKTGKDAVSYLDDVPNGGWRDEYKTKKMAFRKIDPGSFEYMPGKSFKITKPFYIGVFEVTQKQYEMVMKGNPSEFKGDMRPVERVSYADIRGSNKGLGWPKDNLVDDDSYLGRLRKGIGLEFDLPTEVQLEYACRADTTGKFNVDGVDIVKLGKCADNGGRNDHHVKVGSFLPNAWGLYDMYGNVWEWCLDRGPDGYTWMRWTADAKETDTDPKGPAVGASRFHHGGGWHDDASVCHSGRRPCIPASVGNSLIGLRLACPAGAEDDHLKNSDKQRDPLLRPSSLRERRAQREAERKRVLEAERAKAEAQREAIKEELREVREERQRAGGPQGRTFSLRERRAQCEAERAKAEAQREAERAKVEAQREAERAKVEAQREEERVKAEAQREAERDKQKRELEALKAELRKAREAQLEAERAKVEAQREAKR